MYLQAILFLKKGNAWKVEGGEAENEAAGLAGDQLVERFRGMAGMSAMAGERDVAVELLRRAQETSQVTRPGFNFSILIVRTDLVY